MELSAEKGFLIKGNIRSEFRDQAKCPLNRGCPLNRVSLYMYLKACFCFDFYNS